MLLLGAIRALLESKPQSLDKNGEHFLDLDDLSAEKLVVILLDVAEVVSQEDVILELVR